MPLPLPESTFTSIDNRPKLGLPQHLAAFVSRIAHVVAASPALTATAVRPDPSTIAGSGAGSKTLVALP
jgi:hypothetical protein